MADITRKKHTGEAGNGGQFGHKTHREDGIALPSSPVAPTETQRARRGHEFFPKDFTAWPKTLSGGSTPVGQKPVMAHYFVGAFDWYVTEADADGYAFGYTRDERTGEGGWGYMELSDMEQTKIGWNVVERDLWHTAGTMARDCIPELMSQRNVVEKMPYSEKTPPVGQWVAERQDNVRRNLSAFDDKLVDNFVGSIEEGHLSRGTPGEKGTGALTGWRVYATTEAANPKRTPAEREAFAEFSAGLQRTIVEMFGDKLGIEEAGALSPVELEHAARQGEQLATTKRASKSARAKWQKMLSYATSEAEWRGRLVGAAALSHTDSWWGFRDDTVRTATVGAARGSQPR